MNITMYEIIEQGYLLNISLVLALLAILSRFLLGIVLDSMSKDSENMAKAKSKFAKNYKQKVEQTFGVERVVNDTEAFVEKYVRKYRFLWISLRGWHLLAVRLLLVAISLNVFSCAYGVLYDVSEKQIEWSIAINILMLLLCVLAMSFTDFNYKYAGIKVNMRNYIENEYKNHQQAVNEAKQELEQKEQTTKQQSTDKVAAAKSPKLSTAEEKIIQDVIKEFL